MTEYVVIHERFEEIAQKYPDNIALRGCDVQLTYRELNNQANHLCQRLIKANVRPGDIVSLELARCNNLFIAMLATLKAGAAYLPVADDNPLARNLDNLEQANVAVVISENASTALLENGRRQHVALAGLSGDDRPNPRIRCSGDDKAYVMFTSGSTGRAKGVVVPHRAVTRLVINTNYVDVNEHDHILQFAPVSFDASTFEIWAALLNGAELAIYSEQSFNPHHFAEFLETEKVTILWLTAALFHLLVNRYIEAFAKVHTVIAGGDVLHAKLINNLLDQYPHLIVINGYGPTENTTFTCCHRMSVDNRPDKVVPIGSAIQGTNIHVLNADKKAVVPGEIGELYVSGAGVALGYLSDLNQSNLNLKNGDTAFFYDDSIGKGLIYKTGDLVLENQEGLLEFCGRKDNQVKVRGFRVSLEEIQHHLMQLDGIDDAIAMVKKFDSGDQLLIAHLQVDQGGQVTVQDIKSALQKTLPTHMIPDQIKLNESLPINKNGKLDKKSELLI